MLTKLRDLRQEFRPMFTLAVPVVLAELGWMTMGLVDTLMVGRIGPEAIGAAGVGSSVFMGVVIFAMGLLLGLDTLVSHAFGSGRLDDCHRWLVHGIVLGTCLAVPLTLLLWWIVSGLDRWGLDPAVLGLTRGYLDILAWSAAPLLLYAAFRRYLQGMGVVRPVMIALVLANVANVIMNWIFIFGHFGAPALGVRGAAWATVVARLVMAGFLLGVIVYRERGRRPGLFQTSLRVDAGMMRRLLTVGAPAAGQITLEVGVFAAATALAGRLAPAALAAHQIAINIAAFTFMVPLGIASAGAVRVGHAVGRRDHVAAARAGWTALLFGMVFMSAAAAAFVLAPRMLIGAFTSDERVLGIGVRLLMVGAVFQLFDGMQGVATGVLRGLGDTRTPMFWNLAGHWFIGLPWGYALCFVLGFGVVGLWWGLSTGLIICGVALLWAWSRRIRAFGPRETFVESLQRRASA
ncbi:MAG TPA: MATE family efflux transporter [Vicinamibacterales bacterium]|nr:MATE family efflux transporter [Vicinamibacterales bacterium]